MGPSGSGKTTLLNVLAGRGVGTLTGSILMNNVPLTKKLKRKIAFVLQEDIFFENLTLRETLVFTACLRLPSTMPYADKLKKVDDIVETLDLRKCLDTKIGSAMDRGLSGGEKKRTNIGSELLNDPAILVLDEPTTGLDSTTACNLIDMLQKYAVTHNKTVITSIHQPSSQIFYKFHKLMLLSEGEVVYFGSSHDVMDFFSSINLHCYIPHYNAADFILDKAKGTKEELDILHKAAKEQRWTTFNRPVPSIAGSVPQTSSGQMNGHALMPADDKTMKENQAVTSESLSDGSGTKELVQGEAAKDIATTEESAPTKESKDASVQEMNTNLNHQEATNTDKQEESPEHMKAETNGFIPNSSEDDGNDDIVLGERWASSWRTQYTTLCRRSFKQNFSEVLTKIDLLRHIVLGIIFGILYFQLDHTEERLHDIRGIIFFGTVYWGFDSVFTTITTFPTERDVVNKERASGMYRLSAYYLAKLTSELPLMIIFPTIHFNIYYWLGGLNNFIGAYLAAWCILILNTLVGQSLGLAISAYSPDMSTAITFLAIYMLSAMMLGGFYVEILPFWLEWTQYLSFLFYTYNLFLRVEFNIRGDPVKCAKEESIFEECITGNATEVDGETALDSMDVLDIPVWANLVALGGFLLVFRLLGYYVLKIKYKPK
ncbi:uncharacterized protein [Amphiura filiformis]|uniref:uncharacterized protein n=1 Tax=Amphiura filiformis TaxID=82378 RepID=UPI003B21E344